MLDNRSTDDEKDKEIKKFEKYLKNLDNILKKNGTDFFSATSDVSAVDFLLQSWVETIVYMYSNKGLND